MQLIDINADSPWLAEVRALYERSFPVNERRELNDLFTVFGDCHEMLVLLADGRFAGFVSLLSLGDLTHILYLAVENDLRGQGMGSEMLRLIRLRKPSARILADLEDVHPAANNNPQRLRRMDFYRRGGYAPSDVRYVWRGENYVMYVSGGELTSDEFEAFWDHF